MTKRALLAEIDASLLLADGFDEAIVGYGQRCSEPPVVIYDRSKCLEILMRDGMTLEEAEEFFSFNVEGAWVGPRTPVFLHNLESEML